MDAVLQSRAEELAKEFASQATTVEELNGLMRLMMKRGLEQMLNTEMDVHLGRRPLGAASEAAIASPPATAKKRSPNRRNGRSKKTVQGDLGEVTLSTPRDRDGTFEPQMIEKHQRRVPGFDEKILALYAKGMTTRDIQEIVRELYGVDVSATLVSAITADLDAEVTAWRTRPLAPVWPIVYFDGIVVHVRGANGRVSQHTIYVALGVNLEGHKELLGLWLGENEGAKFWLSCLTDLKSRGLRDIFVACIDGLIGLRRRDSRRLPADERAVVHRPSGACRAALREHRGQPAGGARPQEDLSGGDGPGGGGGAGRIRSSVGRKVSDDCQAVAGQVDRHRHAVRLPAGDSQGDLHDQRHRIRQQRDPQVHPQPQDIPERGVGAEARVHGDPRGRQEMDHAHPPLEAGPQPLRHPLRGPHARANQQLIIVLA